MTGPILSIEGLSGGYSKLPVFRDVRLSLHAGETIGVCGPNGAGKTTLLKTIAGLLPPLAGHVAFKAQSSARRMRTRGPTPALSWCRKDGRSLRH